MGTYIFDGLNKPFKKFHPGEEVIVGEFNNWELATIYNISKKGILKTWLVINESKVIHYDRMNIYNMSKTLIEGAESGNLTNGQKGL